VSINAAQLRDAVVQQINQAGLTPSLTAIPIYDLSVDLESLKGGRIVVMPQTKSLEPIRRKGDQAATYTIDVAVQFKGADIKPATLDPYLSLAEQIGDLSLGTTLKTQIVPAATCIEVIWPHGLFIQKHLEDFRCLTSVVSLKIKVN